jgi:hypothetical protein
MQVELLCLHLYCDKKGGKSIQVFNTLNLVSISLIIV